MAKSLKGVEKVGTLGSSMGLIFLKFKLHNCW
jgi:hypothetical protein